jgi:uncharacterized NAD-dependent epimerase/dehydratase family protein
VPIDSVVADFVAGAAEALTPSNDADHWDVVEGQGSIFHPAYAGVSLGLLHGTQPDAFVVCTAPARRHLQGFPEFPVAAIQEVIDLTVSLGSLTNPSIQCVGVSLNPTGLDSRENRAFRADIGRTLRLPVFDPLAEGADVVADRLLALCPAADR